MKEIEVWNDERAPVLVEAATAVLAQMLSKYALERTWSSWSIDVADDANDHHWWCLDDCHGFDNFLLVNLRSWLINLKIHRILAVIFTKNFKRLQNYIAYYIIDHERSSIVVLRIVYGKRDQDRIAREMQLS